jgi:hypothetical protein
VVGNGARSGCRRSTIPPPDRAALSSGAAIERKQPARIPGEAGLWCSYLATSRCLRCSSARLPLSQPRRRAVSGVAGDPEPALRRRTPCCCLRAPGSSLWRSSRRGTDRRRVRHACWCWRSAAAVHSPSSSTVNTVRSFARVSALRHDLHVLLRSDGHSLSPRPRRPRLAVGVRPAAGSAAGAEPRLALLECSGIYWHMVDLLWIVLFCCTCCGEGGLRTTTA